MLLQSVHLPRCVLTFGHFKNSLKNCKANSVQKWYIVSLTLIVNIIYLDPINTLWSKSLMGGGGGLNFVRLNAVLERQYAIFPHFKCSGGRISVWPQGMGGWGR